MFYQKQSSSIYYQVFGPKKAPGLCFTHGGGLHSGMFDHQVQALKDQYRIMTWDMAGHGKSSPLRKNLDVLEMARCLLGILDEEDMDRVVVVGQSLGGYVAQYAAIHATERIQGIVSIGSLPIDQPMRRWELGLYRLALGMSRYLPETLIFKRAAGEKAVTEEAREFFYESLLKMGKKQFLYMLGGQLDICRVQGETPSQPLLITHGQHEMPKSLIKGNQKWHESVPGSTYLEIPDAGHNANMDNPEVFNQALLSFLEDLQL